MSKKTKNRLIAIILFILIIAGTITVISAIPEPPNFSLSSLNVRGDKPVFCIARNYHLDEEKTFGLIHTIQIEGATATNVDNSKSRFGKTNAKLAYIVYKAKGESNAEDKDWDWYRYSPAQNAMWKYWKTWYGANGNDLGIKNYFNKKSSEYVAGKGDDILKEADEYYETLTGDRGVSVNNTGAGVSSVHSRKLTENGSQQDVYYYGPFTITEDSEFIGNSISIEENDNNIEYFAQSVGAVFDNFKNYTPKMGDTFYIVATKNDLDEFKVKYAVKRIDATIELYHRNSSECTFQNVMRASAINVDNTIDVNLTLKPKTTNGSLSIQKFVTRVDNNGIGDGSNGEYVIEDHLGISNRENKCAYTTCNNSISENITVEASSFYKSENPVIIDKGDVVLYRITIYNSHDTEKKSCYIKDRYSKDGTTLEGVYTYNSTTDQFKSIDYETYNTEIESYNYIKWASGDIGANSDKRFYVAIRYDKDIDSKIPNKAYIDESKSNPEYRRVDYDFVQMGGSDVSLQKYITSVKSKYGTVNYDNRANKQDQKESIKDIATHVTSPEVTSSNFFYKSGKVVEIEAGDEVTYNIVVYNNGIRNETVTVKDYLPKNATEYKWEGDGSYTKINENAETEAEKTINVDANSYYTLTIHVKYGKFYGDAQFKNEASIAGTTYRNDTEYRTDDADYVKMKNYKVKLEKFIYSVNGDTTGISGREYHPIYNDKTIKYNNVVTVSKDDYVTYKIKVTNEGGGNIKSLDVLDTILGKDSTGAGFAGYYWGEYEKGKEIKTDSKTPKAAVSDLKSGETKYVLITLKVSENNASKQILVNHAEILNDVIVNKNDITIVDSTINNNDDEDYIQLNYPGPPTPPPGGDPSGSGDPEDPEDPEDPNNPGDPDNPIDPDCVAISGYVWNDVALNKMQNNYNALYDGDGVEDKLSGVTVYLYRIGTGYISSKDTDSNGYYSFTDSDINKFTATKGYVPADQNVVKEAHKRYIKGPLKSATDNKWSEEYYSYYIIFEYDGIKYTSTPDGSSYKSILDNENYKTNSNAREILRNNEEFNSNLVQSRTDFNAKYSKINSAGAYNSSNAYSKKIYYDTLNEQGYSPSSIYNFDESYNNSSNGYEALSKVILMKSITDKIDMTEDEESEQKLKYVNLGLRGRDIFDLGLTSDVDNVKVTVNNQQAVYKNSNKVTIRREDFYSEDAEYYRYNGEIVAREDMAHIYSQGSKYLGEEQEQKIRETDLDVSKAQEDQDPNAIQYYDETQKISSIKVTYKITVENQSKTDGTATKIISYYDSRYNFEGAYPTLEDANKGENKLLSEDVPSESDQYKCKTINTNWSIMTEEDNQRSIYIVLKLDKIEDLNKDIPLATFNMSEIAEYKTQCAEDQTEFTRGLIDKDSAPGSANKEKVRLTTNQSEELITTTEGNPTTVKYYFDKKLDANKVNDDYLRILKYEDDTYATPTLYFKSDEGKRTITGNVFEDITQTLDNNVKTGDGVKDKNNEKGIKRVAVQLLEQVDGGDIKHNGKEYVVRYSGFTDENGNFKFGGYLPGNYVVWYNYGNINETFLYGEYAENSKENSKSYNGEDFQSTNNIGEYGAAMLKGYNSATGKFENTTDWYAYYQDAENSEMISTATENSERRTTVSKNVTDFTDEKMTILNNARDGKQQNNKDAEEVANATFMYANAPQMRLTVEPTVVVGENTTKQRDSFGEYNIINMNFGIAEVPVTEIDLQKSVQAFTITDSTGKNVIASAEKKENGKWDLKGDVLAPEATNTIDVSIEDEKLQGARLQVTYNITSKMRTEKNFDNKELTVPTIKGIVDYIDNDLSYNPDLGYNGKKNCDYWEVTTYADVKESFAKMQYKEGSIPQGVIDPDGSRHTTIVKAIDSNPILLTEAGTGTATITLERILSSTDSTIDEIITSAVESYEYSNAIEITGLDYKNVTPDGGTPGESTNPEGSNDPQRDRIRTPERYIILPGVQHDYASSESISIHTPTGDSSIHTVYYVIAAISLAVLAVGAFGIKKFVIKK